MFSRACDSAAPAECAATATHCARITREEARPSSSLESRITYPRPGHPLASPPPRPACVFVLHPSLSHTIRGRYTRLPSENNRCSFKQLFRSKKNQLFRYALQLSLPLLVFDIYLVVQINIARFKKLTKGFSLPENYFFYSEQATYSPS